MIEEVEDNEMESCKDDPAHDVARTTVNPVALQPVWTNEAFGEAQQADRDLALVIHAVENKQKPSPAEASD